MWLERYPEREIAAELDRPQKTVNRWVADLSQNGQLSESAQTLANFAETFEDDSGETRRARQKPGRRFLPPRYPRQPGHGSQTARLLCRGSCTY